MIKIILVLILTTLTSQSYAQDARTWRASIGGGLVFKKNNRANNLYKGLDKNIIIAPIPFITASLGRFSLGAQGIVFRAFGNHLMNVSLFAKLDGDKYLGLGMNPRRQSTFVGLSASFFKYGISAQRDVSGNSHGHTAQFTYGEFFPLAESFMLRTGLSLEWADDRYAEYYYGVRSHEATPNRPEYHLNNYIRPGISFMPIYKITEDLTLTSVLGIKFIPKKLRNSPTMNGKKLDLGGLMTISYSL